MQLYLLEIENKNIVLFSCAPSRLLVLWARGVTGFYFAVGRDPILLRRPCGSSGEGCG